MHIGFNIAISLFLVVSLFAIFYLSFSKTKGKGRDSDAGPDGSDGA